MTRATPSKAGPVAGCPPFVPDAMERQLILDHGLRLLLLLLLLVSLVLGSVWEQATNVASVAAVAFAILWVLVMRLNASVAQELSQLSAMIDFAPDMAEVHIAQALRRRPLQSWVRLLLYYRLAVVRHHQKRYAEAAVICQAVLTHEFRSLRGARAHLLLMLIEADMQCGNYWGAYAGLLELHRQPLTLVEMLQTLALQTRYELACGYYDYALNKLEQKVQLAELMPAHQCAALHALLAVAARRAGREHQARFLEERARLLGEPQMVEAIFQGALAA